MDIQKRRENYRRWYHRHKNESKFKEMRKEIGKRRKDSILAYSKRWYQENKEYYTKYHKEWRIKNPVKILAQNRRKRLRMPEGIKIVFNLRRRINQVLKSQGAIKSDKFQRLLGCTVQQLKEYLENKFKDGMSWENRSKWHIDHVRPLCSFDLNEPEQQKIAMHFKNLQPLWAQENLKKGSKYGTRVL